MQNLCSLAPCGGAPNDSSSPPWGDPECEIVTPTYTPADESPINTVTKCNYFHNLVKEGDANVCKPCGWPGNMCEKECIYGFEFDPVGDPVHGQGRFTVRPEFRTGGALVRPPVAACLSPSCPPCWLRALLTLRVQKQRTRRHAAVWCADWPLRADLPREVVP